MVGFGGFLGELQVGGVEIEVGADTGVGAGVEDGEEEATVLKKKKKKS